MVNLRYVSKIDLFQLVSTFYPWQQQFKVVTTESNQC